MVQTRNQWAAETSGYATTNTEAKNKVTENIKPTPKKTRPAAKKRTPTQAQNAETTKRRAKVANPRKEQEVLSESETEESKESTVMSEVTASSNKCIVIRKSSDGSILVNKTEVVTLSDSDEEDELDRQEKCTLFVKMFIKGFEDMQKAEMSNRIRAQRSLTRIE